MTPQERDVIAGIFDRLRQAANQPRDPEAERYIADRLREQPYAPYAMAQAVYVQEQALTNLQSQVEELQAQVRDLQSRPAEPQAQSGGFLSGIFGGGARAPEPARPRSVPAFPQRGEQTPSAAWSNQSGMAAPMQSGMAGPGMAGPGMGAQQPGPWANQAAQAPARAGGGFMATALTTAAGVAGGMMLGNVLTNAFSGNKSGADQAKAGESGASSDTASTASAGGDPANIQTAGDNSNYDDGSSNEANYQNASHEAPFDGGYDDGASSFGGDDDSWA